MSFNQKNNVFNIFQQIKQENQILIPEKQYLRILLILAFSPNGHESLYLAEIPILVFPINGLFTIFLNFIVSDKELYIVPMEVQLGPGKHIHEFLIHLKFQYIKNNPVFYFRFMKYFFG